MGGRTGFDPVHQGSQPCMLPLTSTSPCVGNDPTFGTRPLTKFWYPVGESNSSRCHVKAVSSPDELTGHVFYLSDEVNDLPKVVIEHL